MSYFSLLLLVPLFVALWKYYLLPFFVKYRFTIGFISKISAISGVNVALLESQRWTFVKNPQNSNNPSETIIVAFAGAALLIGGNPRIEFSKTLAQFDVDQLFLMDPKQSWYLNDPQDTWTGYELHEAKLRDFLANYKKVIFVGASMGASATLIFSHLADYVIAINPQTHPIVHKQYAMRYGARRMPKHLQETFIDIITTNINKSRGSINVYVSAAKADVQQILLLPPKATIHEFNECKDHKLAQHLKKTNKFVPIITEALEALR